MLVTGNNSGDWKDFYREYFGLYINLDECKIPKKIPGFERLIIVAQGIGPNRVLKACSKLLACESNYGNLDELTEGRNQREATKTYAIWVRDRLEADKENAHLSADSFSLGTANMTLLERLLFEIKYLQENHTLPDARGTRTVCAGSRSKNGRVPCVYSEILEGVLCIRWCLSTYSDSECRARSVIV